ncbi:hypothetical protein [Pseudomonas sp. NFACC07-1]|uniref:hypothetical protein n=1 Tax=Pseudomonas sp. NFACC07-1 TaxID=1566239 RepID=UPI0008B34CD6|nr:hypothetical protein [Pseudomonas sp. NFACC07-1]SEI44397.1 hypothetical protein SAMN03159298_00315 [Pseudomonas sp. NFACC07-1]
MAVKVGASLWTMAADQQRPPARDTQAKDFERKIGLYDQSPASNESTGQQRNPQVMSEERLVHSAIADADLARVVLLRSIGASTSMTAEALELYALGAHAGHHLSYLPDTFLAEPGVHSVASIDTEQAYSAPSSALSTTSAISSVPGAVLAQGSDRPRIEPVTIEQQGTEDSTGQPLLSYLNGKWPDRHFQFLPRGKGLELLVRDYRLTAQERDELIEELARRASSMSERPQQIWLNGQQVWRASPLSNDYIGEHDGR